MVILIIVCLSRINTHTDTLRSQQAAQAWKGESEQRFAQASSFLPLGSELEESAVMGLRTTLNSKLEDSGIEIPEKGSLWADAYSGVTKLKVKGTRGDAEVSAIGVGGEFFTFHPYELVSGSYIYESDLMKDRVVLEYELAWRLFGGTDIAGLTVTIGDKPYYVAGVIRRESDSFSERAFTYESMMFISYGTAKELDEKMGINCYELVMANPISSFVTNILNESLTKDVGITLENSTRYDFSKIFSMFTNFGDRSVADSGIAFPYWENAARVSEVYVARLYVYITLLGIVPLICLVWLAVLLVKLAIAKLKLGTAAGKEAWEDRYARLETMKEKRQQRRKKRGEPKPPRRAQRRSAPAPAPAPESGKRNAQELFSEEEVALDIESIVKEIMDENK